MGEADRGVQQNRAVLLRQPPQPVRDPAAAGSHLRAPHRRRGGSPGGGPGGGEPRRHVGVGPLVRGLVFRAGPGVPVGSWEKGGLLPRSGGGARLTRRRLPPAGAGKSERGGGVRGRARSKGGVRREDDGGEHVGQGAVRGRDVPAGFAGGSRRQPKGERGGVGGDGDGAARRRSVHQLAGGVTLHRHCEHKLS